MNVKALARCEIDHPLAIEPVETVANRGNADPEIFGETGRFDPGAASPFSAHQLTLDRLIGRLEHVCRAHFSFLSAAANSDTASAWSVRSASIARSEARRVGTEGVSTCSSRWSP